jgi:hypothetical protein
MRSSTPGETSTSSKSKLIDGFTKQLEIYNRVEGTQHSDYLIIRTTESTAKIDVLLKLRTEGLQEGRRISDIVIVDGRQKPSASKA